MGAGLRDADSVAHSFLTRAIRHPRGWLFALIALGIAAAVVNLRRSPVGTAFAAGPDGRGSAPVVPPTAGGTGAAGELGLDPRRRAPIEEPNSTQTAPLRPGSADSAPVPFLVYPKFRMAHELEADLHVNPDRKSLTDEARAELDRYLELANEILATKQARIAAETQAWGKTLIESGITDSEAAASQAIDPGTTRVGVVLQGRVDVVTVRPGDNAILDDLHADLGAFVRDCWAHVALQFQGPPGPSSK